MSAAIGFTSEDRPEALRTAGDSGGSTVRKSGGHEA